MIVGLGDLLLDMIVRLRSPSATGADADATTQLGPGGQAANVAAWVAELGGKARFVGKRRTTRRVGSQRAGLEAYGVDVRGPVVEGRTGTIVSLVAADGSRTMASDRGVSPELPPTSSTPPGWTAAAISHLPGYPLLRAPIDGAARRAAEFAPRLRRLSLPGARSGTSGPSGFRTRLEVLRPAIVFANEDEERILGGPLESCEWVLKRGPLGARFGGLELPAVAADVLDTTGPEMRWPPGTSSAVRSSRSPRRRGASRN